MRLTRSEPEGLRILHIGGYWRGPNDMVAQMLAGLRDTNADVLEYSTDEHRDSLDTDGAPYDRGTSGPVWLRCGDLAPVIDSFDPHLVVCNAGGLAFRPPVAQALRQRRCLLGIALSDPDVFAATTRRIAPLFDLFLTNADELLGPYAALGARAAPLPIGTNPTFFHPVEPRHDLRCEVLVLGRAHADRIAPVRALVERFDVHLYGEGWAAHGLPSRGVILGREVLAALSSAATTVLFDRTPAGHAIVKVGLFDFLAAGALVLTNRSAAAARWFDLEREVVGFDSIGELLERVRHCLDHPQQAEAIRRAGRARVLAEYTWPILWRRILRLAGELG